MKPNLHEKNAKYLHLHDKHQVSQISTAANFYKNSWKYRLKDAPKFRPGHSMQNVFGCPREICIRGNSFASC